MENSNFVIAMIVLSILAGIGLSVILVLFIQRNTNNSVQDVEKQQCTSLDSHDVFNKILEYPPTKPQATFLPNNESSCTTIINPSNCSSVDNMDPISASLARQSIEERAYYYKSPTRTPPVPYHSCASTMNKNHELEWATSYQVW